MEVLGFLHQRPLDANFFITDTRPPDPPDND
jgi:hypothetical protein